MIIRACLALCVPLVALACHDEAAKLPAPGPVASASAKTPASTFGRPIEAGETLSLVDIAKSPAQYKGKVIATQGTVTRVCQERGCWMAKMCIRDRPRASRRTRARTSSSGAR